MNTQPRRTLRQLLKDRFGTPEALLTKLGIPPEDFLPALMAYDSKTGLGSSTMTAPQVKAKDLLSKNMRRNLDAMSPTMRQALRQHLGKGDQQASLTRYPPQRGAHDQEQNGNSLSPVLASALWQHLAPQIDDETARENFHVLLQQLCGNPNFADLDAEDQLPLLGVLGGLGEAAEGAAGAGEAAAGLGEAGEAAAIGGALGASAGGGGGEQKEEREQEDQSFTSPGPRNFGSMPRPGGSMSPPRPYPPDKSRSRGAMDEALARVKILDCPAVYSNGTPYTGRLNGIEYRHGVPFGRQPTRRQHVAIAMDAASKPARKEAKSFNKRFPEAARIKVI